MSEPEQYEDLKQELPDCDLLFESFFEDDENEEQKKEVIMQNLMKELAELHL